MMVGILVLLIGFYQLLYAFRKSNALFVSSSVFSSGLSRHARSPVAIALAENKTDPELNDSLLPTSCIFGIRFSDGAIGNRMFLFASAYGLARLHACHLYVHPWIIFDLRSTFTVNLNQTPVKLVKNPAAFENRTDLFRRYSACTLFEDLFKIPLPENYTKYELLAVWKYSINFRSNNSQVTHDILKTFLLHPPNDLPRVTWIGVHIRRGDFLSFFKIDTSPSYLIWAMNHYRQKYTNCRFLIASDDKTFVKQHLGHFNDVVITPPNFFHGHDLAALALCEHSILTGGTYSWWAAWFAGGNVIHDLNYPVPFQKCVKEHYFPPWFMFPHNSSSKRNE
ncbi:unnamed protein product [Rotaria sp. Silwood1]|nr:unnamed protein product [Rotaria sp. Silwood1]CAF1381505.1 unnamed protein product [Rotaria sp. Silwood1]